FQRALHPSVPTTCVLPSKKNPTLSAGIQGDIADLPNVVLGPRATLPRVSSPTMRSSSFELLGKLRKYLPGIRENCLNAFRGSHPVEPQGARRFGECNE